LWIAFALASGGSGSGFPLPSNGTLRMYRDLLDSSTPLGG